MNKICEKCGGKCCKGFYIIVMNLNEDMIKYFRAHGVMITKNGLWVPLKCLHFADGKCRIYQTRFDLCKSYECTYINGKEAAPPYLNILG